MNRNGIAARIQSVIAALKKQALWNEKDQVDTFSRFARVCNHVADFNARNKCLTTKLLQQDYRYHKLRITFSKFYPRHYELISKFNVGRKTLLREGLSEPEFYGD